MAKLNCWEYKKCGREPGGLLAKELGICPVAIEDKGEGINGGKNGGRICWAVVRIFCSDKNLGSCSNGFISCLECDFFKLVSKEEEFALKTSQDFLSRLIKKERGLS